MSDFLSSASVCQRFPSDRSPVSDMSLAQRVLLTWVFTLVFLIMLVLKLDGKVDFYYCYYSLSVYLMF